tara:strand:+ start:244 stop:552 length:309 start_codon:yes stop_codon:yes gene_type:complete
MENIERLIQLSKKYNTEIVQTWDDNCDWFFYEESDSSGYPVYISTSNPKKIVISEDAFSVIGESSFSLSAAIMNEDVKKLYFDVDASEVLEVSDDVFDELEG